MGSVQSVPVIVKPHFDTLGQFWARATFLLMRQPAPILLSTTVVKNEPKVF